MIKERLKRFSFLLPSLLGTMAFFLIPLLYCILYSASGTSGKFIFVGVKNFAALLHSQSFRRAFSNTFVLMSLYILLLLLIAIIMYYLLDNSERMISFFTLISSVMFLPSALIVNCVKLFPEFYSAYPRITFFLIFLWKYIGIQLLILKTASRGMDPAWSEAAQLDGAGKLRIFTAIEIFYLLPHIKFLFLFNIIGFFKMFRESYLLYGLYPPEQIYMIPNFFFNNFENANYQRLSVGAVITIFVLCVINILVYKAGEKREII